MARTANEAKAATDPARGRLGAADRGVALTRLST